LLRYKEKWSIWSDLPGADLIRALQFLRCCCLWLIALATAITASAAIELRDAPPRVKPTTAADDCTTAGCHESLLQRKVLHGPVAQGKCLDCHAYEDAAAHRFVREAAPDQGCTAVCHEMKQRAAVHAPGHDGTCSACHDPHGSDHPNMLVADPGTALCATCHEEQSKSMAMGPKPHTSCDACHDPHSSTEPNLLKEKPWKLCSGCHEDAIPRAAAQARSVHAPVRDNCLACHAPHGSALAHQLKREAPELCLSCHEDLKRSLDDSPVVHRAVFQEGGCSTCHLPHFSKLPALQTQAQPQQCLACHDKPLRTADGRTLSDMAGLLRENPIRLGACTACHQPHAAREAQLLSADYPPEFYAPFKADRYKLCFTCHSPELALSPNGAGVTGFADGDRNLHWLHVNQEKGRTCRACHEVHASRQSFHIRESVPFGPGGWKLSVRFEPTRTGGRCLPGCHVEKSYDHGDRPRTVPFAASAPRAVLAAAVEAPAEAAAAAVSTTRPAVAGGEGSYPVPPPPFTPGVFPCSGCHDPNLPVNAQPRVLHKPHDDIRLTHDEEHRWCLDCHNAENRDVLRSAAGAPIPFAESYRLCGQCHGVQFRDWKAGVHGKRTGQWNGRQEYLLCVHCHDPHSPKFKPMAPDPPPHRPGVARTSEAP
jgi:predicted CXXCH cytochrome family protein